MHVTVLSNTDLKESATSVVKSVRRLGIECGGLLMGSRWAVMGQAEWESRFEGVSHMIVISDGTLPDWFHYFVGLATGRCMPIAVVGGSRLPPVYDHVRVVSSDAVQDYVLSERSTWERVNRVASAHGRLKGLDNSPDGFYQAVLQGDRGRVDDFLTVGMDPGVRTTEGVPMLVGAVRGGVVEIVQQLLGAGADVDAPCGEDGTTALCEAASRGNPNIVGVLLSHGADSNKQTQSGQTALMLAASQGHLEIVRHLISAGAATGQKDSLGMSALDYARLFGRTEIMDLLETGNTDS